MPKATDSHNIVMFRLERKMIKNMGEMLTRDPIIGVRSTNQLARKLVKDYMEGRLAYTNPKYAKADTDLIESETADAAR